MERPPLRNEELIEAACLSFPWSHTVQQVIDSANVFLGHLHSALRWLRVFLKGQRRNRSVTKVELTGFTTRREEQ